jgi:hypothetical protein
MEALFDPEWVREAEDREHQHSRLVEGTVAITPSALLTRAATFENAVPIRPLRGAW